MEWQAYLDRIDTGTGGRYHTGTLTTDAPMFDAVLGADDNEVLNGLRARYAFHAIRDT